MSRKGSNLSVSTVSGQSLPFVATSNMATKDLLQNVYTFSSCSKVQAHQAPPRSVPSHSEPVNCKQHTHLSSSSVHLSYTRTEVYAQLPVLRAKLSTFDEPICRWRAS